MSKFELPTRPTHHILMTDFPDVQQLRFTAAYYDWILRKSGEPKWCGYCKPHLRGPYIYIEEGGELPDEACVWLNYCDFQDMLKMYLEAKEGK